MELTVRQFVSRYGPALALVGTLVLLVAIVPGRTSGPTVVAAGGASAAKGGSAPAQGAAPQPVAQASATTAPATTAPAANATTASGGSTGASTGGSSAASSSGASTSGGSTAGATQANSGGEASAAPANEQAAASNAPAANPESRQEVAAPPAAPGDDMSRCRTDGRQVGFSLGEPPCKPLWKGGTNHPDQPAGVKGGYDDHIGV